jgi:hypothetical protein
MPGRMYFLKAVGTLWLLDGFGSVGDGCGTVDTPHYHALCPAAAGRPDRREEE